MSRVLGWYSTRTTRSATLPMIALHYGYHDGTTGVHFESALRRRTGTRLFVKRARSREHFTLESLQGASAYLWIESGVPSYPLDPHRAECATAAYLIDVHLHTRQCLILAPLFDRVFIAQQNYLEAFRAVNPKTEWLPLRAQRSSLGLNAIPFTKSDSWATRRRAVDVLDCWIISAESSK